MENGGDPELTQFGGHAFVSCDSIAPLFQVLRIQVLRRGSSCPRSHPPTLQVVRQSGCSQPKGSSAVTDIRRMMQLVDADRRDMHAG